MTTKSGYHLLIEKLDEFIRKFYFNKILRGSLIVCSICLGLFLLYTFAEHQFYFSKAVRKSLLFTYIATAIAALGYWVIWPVAQYLNLGQKISHEQAAQIIGNHFSDVQDKLLNVLQLKKEGSQTENALITAGIDQKAKEIQLVPFKSAIDLSVNKKYLKYAVPPALIFLFTLFAAPSIITDATYRIIKNNQDFERAAPFQMNIQNDNLQVVQFDDYELTVQTTGEQLPSQVAIRMDGYDYPMQRVEPDKFVYTFKNVRNTQDFQVVSGQFSGPNEQLEVLPIPKLRNQSITLDYPSYTLQEDEIIDNQGNLTVPEGTQAQWDIQAQDATQAHMRFAQGDFEELPLKNGVFHQEKRLTKSENYKLTLSNNYVGTLDTLQYQINVIKDQFPTISLESIQDSTTEGIIYFIGNGADDYGVTKVNFVYTITDPSGTVVTSNQKSLPITPSAQVDFKHLLDIPAMELGLGQKLSYYFEIWDNDQVNGSKSSKSGLRYYQQKTKEELKEEEQKNEEKVKDKLDEATEEAQKIQEELQKLRDKLLQKKQPNWQDKKQLQQLMERQQQLQKNLEEAQQANEQNLQNQQQLQTQSPQLEEKQKRLQELFEEVVNDEMQKLMDDIKKLMEELDKDEAIEKMEEFKMNEEELQNEMERLSELYKQLEVEKEVNEMTEELEKLAEELEKLAEETKKEDAKLEEKQEEQKEIEKDFEELEKKLDELMKKNDQLEFPKDIPQDAPEQMDDIQEDMEDSQNQMQQQDSQKAAEKQKQAAEKMKSMASQMQSSMQGAAGEQMMEDIQTIRQLLENLVTLSFDQEQLVNNVNRSAINTPYYVSLVQEQLKLKDDFTVVEDSLKALAKRQDKIQTFVLEKVIDVKQDFERSLKYLEAREKPEANQFQRSTMTYLNDLALMLSESMQQMQQQMAGMMSGDQMCQSPGNKKGKKPGQSSKPGGQPMDRITEGQKKLSEEMKKLGEKMKKGQKPSAKEFAGAAARQAALRKALEEIQKQEQEQGKGLSNELQEIINQMDQQEIDLVNKRLDNDMLRRQQEIMTRLLQAENATREREYDEKRKSREAEQQPREVPPAIEAYLKERNAQLEKYKYISPDIRPYYRKLVDQYYQILKK